MACKNVDWEFPVATDSENEICDRKIRIPALYFGIRDRLGKKYIDTGKLF